MGFVFRKCACGETPEGATNWVQYGSTGLYVDVDTSKACFLKTPTYITSIQGRTHHWVTKGATSIYYASPTGFRIYIKHIEAITPTEANQKGWHINWIGVE